MGGATRKDSGRSPAEPRRFHLGLDCLTTVAVEDPHEPLGGGGQANPEMWQTRGATCGRNASILQIAIYLY